jgi:hypothetical protein
LVCFALFTGREGYARNRRDGRDGQESDDHFQVLGGVCAGVVGWRDARVCRAGVQGEGMNYSRWIGSIADDLDRAVH